MELNGKTKVEYELLNSLQKLDQYLDEYQTSKDDDYHILKDTNYDIDIIGFIQENKKENIQNKIKMEIDYVFRTFHLFYKELLRKISQTKNRQYVCTIQPFDSITIENLESTDFISLYNSAYHSYCSFFNMRWKNGIWKSDNIIKYLKESYCEYFHELSAMNNSILYCNNIHTIITYSKTIMQNILMEYFNLRFILAT